MTWFVDYLPVTTGNDVRIYVDGREYCSDLHVAINEAKSSIFLTGLHFMWDFRLERIGSRLTGARTELAWVLANAGMRGVSVYLLVNQFWTTEHDIIRPIDNRPDRLKEGTWSAHSGDGQGLHRRLLVEQGGLYNYLPETYRLFSALAQVPNVNCYTDIHPQTWGFGTHHQKTVVVDNETAFLGGIDLTYIDGDRWDTNLHQTYNRNTSRTERYWHDIHCRIRGDAVDFVRDNFVQRWNHGNLHRLTKYSNGRILATPVPSGPRRPNLEEVKGAKSYPKPTGKENEQDRLIQIVRSMPADYAREGAPSWNESKEAWERSCKDAYLIGIEAAQRYIYLENQWIADEHIWAALLNSARKNQNNPNFRILLMLPHHPLRSAGAGRNQELFIGREIEALVASLGDRFGMYSLVQGPHSNAVPTVAQIYVHSKILIVDDCWALIGSANAGGISLEGHYPHGDRPDTELSAIILDKSVVSDFRRRLWSEHLGNPVSTEYLPSDADRFQTLAHQRAHDGQKLRFFPAYGQIRGASSPSSLPSNWHRMAELYSVIVPSFPGSIASALPVGWIRPSFRVSVKPSPPSFGDRCLYQWRCHLFDKFPDSTPTRIEMLSLNGEAVDDFTVYSSAYISDAGARQIERLMQDEAWGVIECRVGLVSWDKPASPKRAISVKYPCRFIRRSRISELSQELRRLLPLWNPK
ncbi:phospholipase D-like domain-containing protein [Sorangium sp. So ce131]|uniref:phospholipase D-like domain-containing protein n=1 Tax=Sorangium sp. So ce131 TaxID=3133282 RepID=UPI003F5FB94C